MCGSQAGARVLGVVVLTVAVAAVGCSSASTYQMEAGERTLGSSGHVEVTTDDNKNRAVDLQVSGLPSPNDLHQQKSTFSVWVVPDEDEPTPVNAGQLRIDEDGAGQIKFTTPHRKFEMMITAEASETEGEPSDETVLRQSIGD